MPNSVPVSSPAGYAPLTAVGYSESDSSFSVVAADKPLPVNTFAVPAPAALAGTTATSGVAGPFIPVPARPVVLALSGTWSGTVRVLRSIDGGTTKLPLTAAGQPWGQFSSNCCEPVWEEAAGASLFIEMALNSGTLTYRMAQ